MDCRRARELLNDYMDGQLNAGRGALEDHLGACPACGEELGGLLAVKAAVRSAPRHRAPEGFAARVMERLPGREGAPEAEEGLFGWLRAMPLRLKVAEAVAVAAAAMIGIYSAGFLLSAINGDNAPMAEAEDNIITLAFLDHLDAMPPASMGEIYLSAEENGNE